MNRFSLFSRRVRSSKPAQIARRKLLCEPLETRQLMAADYNWLAADGGMKDLSTGLVWSGPLYTGAGSYLTSTTYAENSVQGGYSDWRLPTLTELTLATKHDVNNNVGFTGGNSMWTSTKGSGKSSHYAVDIYGNQDMYGDGSSFGAIAVRGTASPAIFTQPNVRVYSQHIATVEPQGAISFQVVVDTMPTADVIVPLSLTNTVEGILSTPSLVFSPANWNTPQRVWVAPVDDDYLDGTISYQVITGDPQSSDSGYDALGDWDVIDIGVASQDNERLLVPSTPDAQSSENGDAARQTIRLGGIPVSEIDGQPVSNVVAVEVWSDDESEGVITTPTVLYFDPSNWNVPQEVVVQGVGDGLSDGDVVYHINRRVQPGSNPLFVDGGIYSSTFRNIDNAPHETFSTGTLNLTIPDPGTLNSTLNVSGPGTVGDLNVVLSMSHPDVSQVRVSLIAPDGTEWNLTSVTRGVNFTDTVLDDEATLRIDDQANSGPYTGSYRPAAPLSGFDGKPIAGTWTLRVVDSVRVRKQTAGILLNWSMQMIVVPETVVAAPSSAESFDAAILLAIEGTETKKK